MELKSSRRRSITSVEASSEAQARSSEISKGMQHINAGHVSNMSSSSSPKVLLSSSRYRD